ncbi:HET-domain-containing protein [Xylariaceae sp. AK1471]|nr:HET-domain-containing protein [Xylariaceae sp. AK1471]
MSLDYEYRPLRTRADIRVLELLPGPFDNPIMHCNIVSTNIKAATGKFEALSYTWGDPTPCKTIFCNENNARLDVPFNCYNALRYLRHRDKIRIMWIDAICINQTDVAERNSQVWIMDNIFAAAGQTIVFLGDSTPGSRTLFQHLAETDQWVRSGHSTDFLPRPKQSIIFEMEQLFNRPWFYRIWVIQELMNSMNVTLMCGHDLASLYVLDKCLFGYERNTRVIKVYPAPIELYRKNVREDLRAYSTPAQQICLLAAKTGLSKSSDPRDRILALTPLVKNRPLELMNLIDYNKSIEAIFYEFALLLLSDGGLALLSMIRNPHSRDMPSWVPDWSKNYDKDRWLEDPADFFARVKSSKDYKDFNISSPTVSSDGNNLVARLLIVKGLRYGYIDQLGPLIHIDQQDASSRIKSVHNLVADLNSIRRGFNLSHWPGSIMKALRRIQVQDIFDLLKARMIFTGTIGDDISSNIARSCNDRRIFLTSDGRLGMSPKEAQQGDIVCLIKGAMEPCILRERDYSQWSIISGDSFLLDMQKAYLRSGFGRFSEYVIDIILDREEEFIIS